MRSAERLRKRIAELCVTELGVAAPPQWRSSTGAPRMSVALVFEVDHAEQSTQAVLTAQTPFADVKAAACVRAMPT